MEKDTGVIISKTANLKITFDYDNLNIHIEDSWQVVNSMELEEIVDRIVESDYFRKMAVAGYTRTKESLIREWKAHNVLYRWGYEKERTGSTDLDQHESCGRRLCYFFLSWLY